MLVENEEIICENEEIAEIFNTYFQISGSVESLGITENKLLLNGVFFLFVIQNSTPNDKSLTIGTIKIK